MGVERARHCCGSALLSRKICIVTCGVALSLLFFAASEQPRRLLHAIAATGQMDREALELNLPYQTDTEAKLLLRMLLESGALLRLARTVGRGGANAIFTEHYPALSLVGHKFRTLDGRALNLGAVVSSVLREYTQPVPNVVHFYLFSKTEGHRPELRFHEYLAFLGALWLAGADKVILWCNLKPTGMYWDKIVLNVTAHGAQDKILIASRPLPTKVFNQSVAVIHHQVDVMKLQTAILIGGIFLDFDTVTVRSIQQLRRHDCAIGREMAYGLAISAFMTKPSSKFLLIWYMLYQSFVDEEWSAHSILLPQKVWEMFPLLCHVEDDTMVRPNWTGEELHMLYNTFDRLKRKWNWDKNYMVHLWSSSRPIMNETTVRSLNSMYGEVARHILYGTKRLL